MFDFIRTHRRLMQFVLLLLIFPSFVFFGLEGYTRLAGNADAVARVGGQTISRQEFEAAQREQMERMRQMFGSQFDPSLLDTPQARRDMLEVLIVQRMLALEAADRKLAVSDQALQQAILNVPGLTGEDGRFDVERYKDLLAQRGMTPALFEARLRHDMVLQQVGDAVQATAIAPRTVTTRLSDLNDQVREVQTLHFPTSEFLKKVELTDEMLKHYYENNAGEFTVPAQVDAEYVVLSMDAVAKRIDVSEADINSYYEQNAARFGEPEQRRASHILITVPQNAPEEERAAARKKAEELLAAARQNPDSFADLARKHSQDPGSAEQGGDLDFFSRGMMVKPFEDAVFALKEQGQISDVVESEYGFHIIKLTGIKPATVKPLAEVRDQVEAEIRQQQASREFTVVAEKFTNMVYEQPDSLEPVAKELGLEIQKADGLTRTPDPKRDAKAPVNQPSFLEALFSDEAIKNKNNTDAIEVAPGTLIAGRVLAYRPQTTRPFEEVETVVRERVRRQEAEKLARAAGEERLKALREGAQAAGFGAPQQVSRVKPEGMPEAALSAVMKADAEKLPAYVGVDLPQGYAVYRVNSVSRPQTPDTARREAEQRQIENVIAQQEMFAYLEALKKKYEVEVMLPAPAANQEAG